MATFYIVACCDKDERLFLNIFISEIFNLIFIINNVLKNTLSELLSLAWEIVFDEWDRCL